MLERDSDPRPEARKEEKGKRRAATVTPEFAGDVGKQDTCGKLIKLIVPRGVETGV